MELFLDHIAFNVVDTESMVNFYTQVLQFAPERVDLFKAGKAMFPSVRISENTIIDFFPESMWNPDSDLLLDSSRKCSLNHFCLTVSHDQWLELEARLDCNNIPIVEGPGKRWGSHGTGTSIYFLDPEGNKIEVKYYDKS